MSEENPHQEPEASLPPQPISKKRRWRIWLGGVGIAVAGGAAILFPALSSVSCTRGATRSFRLKWEQRRQEIDAAVRADHVAEPTRDSAGQRPAGG